MLHHSGLESQGGAARVADEEVAGPEAESVLEVAQGVEDVVQVVRMVGVTGGVCGGRGGVRVRGVGGEAVVDGGEAGDVVELAGLQEEVLGGEEGGGVDLGIAPGAAVDVDDPELVGGDGGSAGDVVVQGVEGGVGGVADVLAGLGEALGGVHGVLSQLVPDGQEVMWQETGGAVEVGMGQHERRDGRDGEREW